MKLTTIRIIRNDSCGDGDTCPTLALTDRDTYVVVGQAVTDTEALGSLRIGPGELAVEVPPALLKGVITDAR